MRIAMLIVAHNTPRHLQQLVRALRDPHHHIFVHVDAKADIEPFLPAAAADVTFIDRREVEWGDMSCVDATLDLLRAARRVPGGFDYYALISGSEYPLYTAAEIHRFLEDHAGLEFISIVEMPCDRAGKPISRFEDFYPRKGKGFTLAERLRARRHRGRKRDYRRALGPLRPFGGSAWWALSDAAVDEVFRFVAEERRAVAFLANTYIPEEAFFQTVIGNSHLMPKVSRGLSYTDWSKGGPNPATITDGHLSLFARDLHPAADDAYGSGVFLFARKFADGAAAQVREIDGFMAAKTPPPPTESGHAARGGLTIG